MLLPTASDAASSEELIGVCLAGISQLLLGRVRLMLALAFWDMCFSLLLDQHSESMNVILLILMCLTGDTGVKNDGRIRY